MSNILKRPMFKRGGTPNTGIMDGFNDGGRVGFQGGGSDIRRQMLQFGEREEQQPTATEPRWWWQPRWRRLLQSLKPCYIQY